MGYTCAFTGHRSGKLPWRYDETDPRCLDLKARIRDVIEAVYSAAFDHFICGMADGCDLYFCEAVLGFQKEHPGILLEAAVPFPGQAERWPLARREHYNELLALCDKRTLISPEYTYDCMMKRNRYMVDNAQLLIACYDGLPGGTHNTYQYAVKAGKQVIHVTTV